MKTNLHDSARMLAINVEVNRSFIGYKIKVTHRDGSTSNYRFLDKDERLLINTTIVSLFFLFIFVFALSRI